MNERTYTPIPPQNSVMRNVKSAPTTTENGNNKFLLDVNTYILILELANIDKEKKTCNVWVELGFCYDVHDYIKTFDYFTDSDEKNNVRDERLNMVAAKDMTIPFDILNAVSMDLRSEAHFIREIDGGFQPNTFYTESKEFNNNMKESHLSEAKNLVNNIDISNCARGQYWKHETRTFRMDLSYHSTERLAPFDQMHLIFKLITANCRPGTNRIKFVYNELESDFSGMKHPISGFYPENKDRNGQVRPIINNAHSYENSDISYDRLYISVPFKRDSFEGVITYYIVPFLLFNYLVIKPTEALLGISSTLVIANVALLIVSKTNTLKFYEQAVLIQVVVLIIATLFLAFFDHVKHIRFILAFVNFVIFCLATGFHYTMAYNENKRVIQGIRDGDYSSLNLT